MKHLYSLLLILFSSCSAQSQQLLNADDFVGRWKFIALQDENGIKHTKIPMYYQGTQIFEVIVRPDYIFFKNGDYIATNQYKSENGKWFFDSKENQLNLSLRIATNNSFFKFLLEKNVIKKAADGNYYQEPISERILKYSEDTMVIADNYPYVLIYKRY